MAEPITAWAILDDRGLDASNVAPTRIGAIVNWLCMRYNQILLAGVQDDQIEQLWALFKKRGNAEAVEVTVSIRAD